MHKLICGAIALALAVPAAAQTAPAEPKADCCEKTKAEGKECCCKDMAGKGHGERGEHGGHAKSGHEGHQR